MSIEHFIMFAGGFLSAWSCFQIQAEALRRVTRRKPRPRKPSFAELLMPPPRDQDTDWRRSFNHENMNKPSGPPPFRLQRSGYRSINYPDPSPDRRLTDPFTGERIPNQPPRNP